SIEDAMVAKITKQYPFLAPAKIPANTYKGQTEDVKTIAVMAVLIALPKLSEQVGYNITKALIENQAELASAHAKGKELSLQGAVKGVSIPFHPGALKYFKEKGALK
ncbi:MAG: TAXI family TRAP transporter solute-binding subunit, partial [candidate division NC10 bacterium]